MACFQNMIQKMSELIRKFKVYSLSFHIYNLTKFPQQKVSNWMFQTINMMLKYVLQDVSYYYFFLN